MGCCVRTVCADESTWWALHAMLTRRLSAKVAIVRMVTVQQVHLATCVVRMMIVAAENAGMADAMLAMWEVGVT